MTNTETRQTVVYTGKATHRVAERQGPAVLTGCGLTLTGYSTSVHLYPTCKPSAARGEEGGL